MQSLSHCTADNGIFLSSIWRSWPHLSSWKKRCQRVCQRVCLACAVHELRDPGLEERGRQGADLDVTMGDLLEAWLKLSFLGVSQETPAFGVSGSQG